MVCCCGVDRSPCFEASIAKTADLPDCQVSWSCCMWVMLGRTVTPEQWLEKDRTQTSFRVSSNLSRRLGIAICSRIPARVTHHLGLERRLEDTRPSCNIERDGWLALPATSSLLPIETQAHCQGGSGENLDGRPAHPPAGCAVTPLLAPLCLQAQRPL